MENSVQVLSNQIQIREWAGQRVVTFQDIDTVHQRPRGTASLTFVQSLGKSGFSLVRPRPLGLKGASKSKQSSRKYVCPGCGAIIRATKEVYVICGECELPFVEQE